MMEMVHIVRSEARGIWRYRWTALAVIWGVCVAGFIGICFLPNMYEARAQVYVDADSRLVEVMGQVGVAPGVGASVFVVQQAMLGRPQLEKVARDTGLALRAKTEEKFDALIVYLQENISIATGRRSEAQDLYTISFRDKDRAMAVSVVRTLLDTFVKDVLELNDQGSDQATGYLQDQLDYYRQLLSDSEKALADFKKENIGLLPGESGGVFERLQTEMDLIEDLKLALSIETDQYEELRSQIKSENPYLPEGATLPGTMTTVTASPTEAAIRELESSKSKLLLEFTDHHPDVIAMQEQLDQLYVKRQAELDAMVASGDGDSAANATNPVYQSIQIALNDAGVRIAGMRGEIKQHEAIVQDLRSKINVIPDVEAEYANLTRNYVQYQGLYNELVVQKERERMGAAGEQREVVNFNIVEPPAAALEPVAPKRTLLLFVVLVMACGVGGAVAYIRHTSNPVFSDVKSLRQFSGRPVLGAISVTWEERYRSAKRLELMSYSAVGLLLLVFFACSLVFQDAAVNAVQTFLEKVTT